MGFVKSAVIYSVAILSSVSSAMAHSPTGPIVGTVVADGQPQNEVPQELAMTKEEFLKDFPTETEKVLPYIFEVISLGDTYIKGKNTTYNVVSVDKVGNGETFNIKPRFDRNQKLHFDFYIQKSLAANPVYVLQVLSALQTFVKDTIKISSQEKAISYNYQSYMKDGVLMFAYHLPQVPRHTVTPSIKSALQAIGVKADSATAESVLLWAERKVNAESGSAYAMRETKENQLRAVRISMLSFPNFSLLTSLTEEQKKAALLEIAQVKNIQIDSTLSANDMAISYFTSEAEKGQAELVLANKLAEKQYTKERKYLDSSAVKDLKKQLEDMPKKLDNFVEANDREGVAKLLEGFLPLEVMEPMEKGIWLDWIEAIRHPNRATAKLMFRGLDIENDIPQVALDKNKKPVGYGFFSTILTRNQGNFTRRLRSLTGMRYKFNEVSSERSPVEKMPSITGQMIKHAGSPQGSPFLSFTSNPKVAYGFSGRGFLAVKIDERRFLPNMVSTYERELELLVPLIVFPDEVVYFEEYPNRSRGGIAFDDVVNRMNAKLGHSYELDIEKDSKKLFLGAYKIFADGQDELGGQCRNIFLK